MIDVALAFIGSILYLVVGGFVTIVCTVTGFFPAYYEERRGVRQDDKRRNWGWFILVPIWPAVIAGLLLLYWPGSLLFAKRRTWHKSIYKKSLRIAQKFSPSFEGWGSD